MTAMAATAGIRRFWRRSIVEPLIIIWHNKRAFVGLLILIFFFLMATVGPEVVPLDMKSRYAERFQPPSREHWLGTDYAGRDVWALIVHGSREVLFVAFLAAVFTIGIGITVGMFAGLRGGLTDTLLMILTNAILTVPSFPVMLIIGSVLDIRNVVTFGALLSIWAWGGLARATRSQVLSLKEREFIEAARVLGLSTPHIVFQELLPNIMPYVTINFLTTMRGAITASVGLMLLGLVPFSSKNWGMMMNMAMTQ
jgi:peptide/nickel transport system permease protein